MGFDAIALRLVMITEPEPSVPFWPSFPQQYSAPVAVRAQECPTPSASCTTPSDPGRSPPDPPAPPPLAELLLVSPPVTAAPPSPAVLTLEPSAAKPPDPASAESCDVGLPGTHPQSENSESEAPNETER